MECKDFTTELANYLEDSFAGKKPAMSPALAKHISECEDCREIVTDTKLSFYFLKMYRNHSKKEVKHSQILPHQMIKRPGQIWRFSYDEEAEPQICAISSKSFNTSATAPYAVWIIPIKLNPNIHELTLKDITFKSSETELDIPVLLETWNKCPIYTSQLIDYVCDLSDAQWAKITEQIQNPPQEELNSTIQVFREHEFSMVEQFYSAEFLKSEKSAAILNYKNGSNIPWLAKIKDAFLEFINKLMSEDVAQLPFKTNINESASKALILKPSKARSILDSVFSFFNSIDSNKLWKQTKTISGAIGNLICAMGKASITALSESASTFYRELKRNENQELIKISSKLCAIERTPDKSSLKLDSKPSNILKNVSNFIAGLSTRKKSNNDSTGQDKVIIPDSEIPADFSMILEDEKLISISSKNHKHFNLRIVCNECYFDFGTTSSEIVLSKNRISSFNASDISSIEIETDTSRYFWKI